MRQQVQKVGPTAETRKRDAARELAGDDAERQAAAPAHKSGEEIKAELDEILAEIDEVLEDNAEEFVKNYVQKGGE